MVATYNPALATALDRVRHAIGDTNEDQPLRDDTTISAVLVIAGTTGGEATVTLAEKWATAEIASALAVEYAQRPDSFSKSGGISVSWRDRVKAWQALAKTLYAEVAAANAATESGLAGAVSIAVIRADVDGYSEYYREPSGYGRNWFTE